MKSTTLLIPHELNERDLALVLEQRFDAGWFPEYHRWSITTDDATVYIDADSEYVARLDPDEQRDMTAQAGFVPRAALHVIPSKYYSHSGALAEQLIGVLCQLLDGRTISDRPAASHHH